MPMEMSEAERREVRAAVQIINNLMDNYQRDGRLRILQIAWNNVAQEGRAEAVAFPGGFDAEQARQIAVLEKMLADVKSDSAEMTFSLRQPETNEPA